MSKNYDNIESFLNTKDFSNESEDFQDTLKNRLQYKLETNTLSEHASQKKRMLRLRPAAAFTVGIVTTMLVFTATVFGDNIIKKLESMIQLGANVTVDQVEEGHDYYTHEKMLNQLMDGKIFDVNGYPISYYVENEFGHYVENPMEKYKEDGTLVYRFSTEADDDGNAVAVVLYNEEEFSQLIGTTMTASETRVESLSKLEEARSSINWNFLVPSALPEGFSFDHATLESFYGNISTVLLTYGKDGADFKEVQNDSLNGPDKITVRIQHTKNSEIDFKFGFGIDVETLECNGVTIVTGASMYIWTIDDVFYNCHFFGSQDEFITFFESMK